MTMRRRDFLVRRWSPERAWLRLAGSRLRTRHRLAAPVDEALPHRLQSMKQRSKSSPRVQIVIRTRSKRCQTAFGSATRCRTCSKLDWATGKVLEDFVAEAHNTSGLAVGGGFCGSAQRRGQAAATRQFNRALRQVVRRDRQVRHEDRQAGAGISHAMGQHARDCAYDRATDKLWAVAPGQQLAVEMDRRTTSPLAHGLHRRRHGTWHRDVYDGALWILAAADRLVRKHDLESGRVLETWTLGPNDPDPHGLCIS